MDIGTTAAVFLAVSAFLFAFGRLAHVLLSQQANADEILQVGGLKFSGHEALMGSLVTIVLVMSVVLYGSLRQEVNDIETAQVLGSWHMGSAPGQTAGPREIADWLMDGASQVDDEDLLNLRADLATSMADRHGIARSTFRLADLVVRYAVWFVALLAILQSLLISRHLHGLRILMPAMTITLVVLFLVAAPGFRLGGMTITDRVAKAVATELTP